MLLDSMLDKAGWLGPLGNPIFDKDHRSTNIEVDSPFAAKVIGLCIETDPKISGRSKDAATTLVAVLGENDVPPLPLDLCNFLFGLSPIASFGSKSSTEKHSGVDVISVLI